MEPFPRPRQRVLTQPAPLSLSAFLLRMETRADPLAPRSAGPLWNYARLFTWSRLASTIHDALLETIDSVSAAESNTSLTENSGNANERCLNVPAQETDMHNPAEICGLASENILPYPRWSDMHLETYLRILYASLVALILQWGTTG